MKGSRLVAVLACVLGATLIFAECALAQVENAEITGVITDPSKAVIPGADIEIVNQQTGLRNLTSTSGEGLYIFRALRPGTYTIRVSASGFKTEEIKDVVLDVGHQARLDMQLTLGQPSEVTTVSEVVPLLQSEGATVGSVVKEKQLLELPINGRNFVALAVLAPGMSDGFSNSWQKTYFGSRGEYSIAQANGLRPAFSTTVIDGVDTQEIYRHWTSVVYPSVDMIQEFKAETSNYNAQFSGGGGPMLNVATKSGTNLYHGTLYDFLQNKALNARNFFLPSNQSKPDEKYNQFGFTAGGPIIKKKTFFFVSYEGRRIRTSFINYTRVPTALERKGDFSESLAVGRVLYDPLTTYADPTVASGYSRLPFTNNIIPSSRLYTSAVKLADLMYPLPNNVGNRTQNYIFSGSNPDNSDQVSVRLDHQISDKDRIFGRWTQSPRDVQTFGVTPGYATLSKFNGYSGVAGWNHVFTPSLLNETRFGYTRYTEVQGSNATQVIIGPGAQVDLPYGSIPPDQRIGLCCFTISGLPNVRYGIPATQYNNVYQLNDKISWTKGKHSIFLGGSIRRTEAFIPKLRFGGFPLWAFQGGFTNNPFGADASKAYDSGIADFLLGLGTQITPFQLLVPQVNGYFYRYETDFFVDDQIRLSPKVTVSIGLRYNFTESLKEKHNLFSTFDFTTGQIVYPTDVPDFSAFASAIPFPYRKDGPDRLYNEPKDNFQPRFSIAWSPWGAKTVVRAGYALYNAYADAASAIQGQTVPPFIISGQRTARALFVSDAFKLYDSPVSPNLSTALSNPTIETSETQVKTPSVQMWNLDIQHQLFKTMTATIGYVGNTQKHIGYYSRPNSPPPGPGPLNCPAPYTGPDCRRPYPWIGRLILLSWNGIANYNGLQANINKRFSGGTMFTLSYTWSKSLGTIDEITQMSGSRIDIYNNVKLYEYGRQGYDFRHILRGSFIAELPVGRERRFLRNIHPAADAVVGGWQLSGLLTLQSGQAFGITGGGDTNDERGYRPDRVCDGSLSGSARTLSRDFNTDCFVNHPPFKDGTSGRNILTQRPLETLNLALQKYFTLPFRGEAKLQFRAEMFDATNTPSFAIPLADLGSPNFGLINATERPNRIVQMGLKVLF